MFLSRLLRTASLRPVPIDEKPLRSLSVRVDLDTRQAKADVKELLDMAREAEAILIRIHGRQNVVDLARYEAFVKAEDR